MTSLLRFIRRHGNDCYVDGDKIAIIIPMYRESDNTHFDVTELVEPNLRAVKYALGY